MPKVEAGETREHYMERCLIYPDLQQHGEETRKAICEHLFDRESGGTPGEHKDDKAEQSEEVKGELFEQLSMDSPCQESVVMAGLALNVANDFRFMVNRETVTLFNAKGVLQGMITDAIRLGGSLREKAPAGGVYLGYKVGWKLPQPEVSGSILPGWYIVDARQYAHVVQSVSNPTVWNAPWSCSCLALVALNSLIHLNMPQNSVDAYTSPITNVTPGVGIPAGINEQGRTELVKFQGRTGYRRFFFIWVMQQLDFLPLGTLITDQAGTKYIVESVENKSRIDELTKINAIINP